MLRSLPLVLVEVWVIIPTPPWNFARKEVLFLFNLDRLVVSARILASLGSELVHYFANTMLLYFSVTVCSSYPDGNYVPVSQSSFVLLMKKIRIEFGTDNIALNIW